MVVVLVWMVDGCGLFVKCYYVSLCDVVGLEEEYCFIVYLCECGMLVVDVLVDCNGVIVFVFGEWIYEVYVFVFGVDLYCGVMLW